MLVAVYFTALICAAQGSFFTTPWHPSISRPPQVHLVDDDTRQLAHAVLVRCDAQAPLVSRTFEVRSCVGVCFHAWTLFLLCIDDDLSLSPAAIHPSTAPKACPHIGGPE